MSAREGLYRLAHVVRVAGSAIGLLTAIFGMIATFQGRDVLWGTWIACSVLGLIIYHSARAIAWIIEGFAKN